MTKLHISQIGLQEKNQSLISPVVWENGAALSNINPLNLIKTKIANESNAFMLNHTLVGLKLDMNLAAKRVETLHVYTSSLQKDVNYLNVELVALEGRYRRHKNLLLELEEQIGLIKGLVEQVDIDKLLQIEQAYKTAKENVQKMEVKVLEATEQDLQLSILKRDSTSISDRIDGILSSLMGKADEYQTILRDLTSRINSLGKLSIVVDKNANAIEFLLKMLSNSVTQMITKQERRAELMDEMATEAAKLRRMYDAFIARLNWSQEQMDILMLNFEDAKCAVENQNAAIERAEKMCDSNADLLEEYYRLIIGCNFLAAGDNIQLNRIGCSCEISAVLPPMQECPVPLLVPSVPPDITIIEGESPECPPQFCESTTTTPKPTTTTSTTQSPTTSTTQSPTTSTTTTSTTTTTQIPTNPNCKVHVSGAFIGRTFKDKYHSAAYKEDEYSNIVYEGEYPSNENSFPKAFLHSFDGIAIAPNTRLIIYSEQNFKGKVVLDKEGPAILNNKDLDYLPDYAKVMTDNNWPEYPKHVRFGYSGMKDWSYGSCKIICGSEPTTQSPTTTTTTKKPEEYKACKDAVGWEDLRHGATKYVTAGKKLFGRWGFSIPFTASAFIRFDVFNEDGTWHSTTGLNVVDDNGNPVQTLSDITTEGGCGGGPERDNGWVRHSQSGYSCFQMGGLVDYANYKVVVYVRDEGARNLKLGEWRVLCGNCYTCGQAFIDMSKTETLNDIFENDQGLEMLNNEIQSLKSQTEDLTLGSLLIVQTFNTGHFNHLGYSDEENTVVFAAVINVPGKNSKSYNAMLKKLQAVVLDNANPDLVSNKIYWIDTPTLEFDISKPINPKSFNNYSFEEVY